MSNKMKSNPNSLYVKNAKEVEPGNIEKSLILNNIYGLDRNTHSSDDEPDLDEKAWKNWSPKYKLKREDGQGILNNSNYLIKTLKER